MWFRSDPFDEHLNSFTFWVQIKGIPLQFITRRMITHIGHTMSHLLETEFEGDGALHVDYVRVMAHSTPVSTNFLIWRRYDCFKILILESLQFLSCLWDAHPWGCWMPSKYNPVLDSPNDDDGNDNDDHPPASARSMIFSRL